MAAVKAYIDVVGVEGHSMYVYMCICHIYLLFAVQPMIKMTITRHFFMLDKYTLTKIYIYFIFFYIPVKFFIIVYIYICVCE